MDDIIEESISEIEKPVSNIIEKIRLMIESIKLVNKTSNSLYLVSIIIIKYEDEQKFIHKYDYYLNLFTSILSFFMKEPLNEYNNDLFNVFIELLYETSGSNIFTKKNSICNESLTFKMFSKLFTSTYINILLYSSPEERNDFFDLIEKEFHIYMNNLYGVIFRSSISKEDSIMIHIDYILRNGYSIYSLDYIFFEELYEFMKKPEQNDANEYEIPINNNNINIINIIYYNQNNIEYNNEFIEENDIYS
jgi:hypothetical protein